MNSSEEMYGEERFLNAVNSIEYKNISYLQNQIKQNVKDFTEGYPQSDDMTMLIYQYNGSNDNKAFYSDVANKENYKTYLDWLNETSARYGLSDAIKYKLELISEEIYTNIFSYAYPDSEGTVEVCFEKNDKEVILRFIDSGIPFNPLDRPDPDTDFPPESREQGGLGIFIVKNMTNDIRYDYLDGKNLLTMKINI